MEPVFIEDVSDIKVVSCNGLLNEIVSAKYHLHCLYRDRNHTNNFFVDLSPADPETFSDFSTLTKEQVLSWVKDAIDSDTIINRKSAMVTFIDQCIEAEQDEPVSVVAPWENK